MAVVGGSRDLIFEIRGAVVGAENDWYVKVSDICGLLHTARFRSLKRSKSFSIGLLYKDSRSSAILALHWMLLVFSIDFVAGVAFSIVSAGCFFVGFAPQGRANVICGSAR